MHVGVDVGYSAVKACGPKQVLFSSVVGSRMPESTYSLEAENGLVIKVGDNDFYTPVGATAMLHSQYTAGRRDEDWVLGDEWFTLFVTALSEFSFAPYQPFDVVLGLPVYDWVKYAEPLRDRVLGRIEIKRRGRDAQVLDVDRCMVITQPYGSLLDLALDDGGTVINNPWSNGLVGVVDLGGNTMNLLVANELEEVSRWTLSDEFGLLHALDNLARRLRQEFTRFNPETHEVAAWLADGKFTYRGESHDIWPYAKDFLLPLIDMASTRILGAWPESSRFNAVLLTGGGSAAIGKYIQSRLTEIANVQIANDPRWANVRGYTKLAAQL